MIDYSITPVQYENSTAAEYNRVKNNFYFLWKLAEEMKKEFYRTNSISRYTFANEKNKDVDLCVYKEPFWKLYHCTSYDKSTYKEDQCLPNVTFNAKEIDKLIRADIYNLDGTNTNYSVSVFNKKQAWNGYQDSNECLLDGIRKFNTWRIQLPRNYGTRDRIRNPFCYIKLKQDQSVNLQTDRVILHDLAVYFDMK